MDEKPVSAMIGPGRWGRNVLRVLADSTTVAYIAHGDSPETKAYLEHTYPESAVVTDYRTALADLRVQAVAIATPIPTHVDIVRDALAAKKHVFCEKPLALRVAEVHELYQLAEANNCALVTGYLYLFDPGFIALQDAVADKPNIEAEFVWEKYGSFDYPLVEQLLVHELAIAHALLGGVSLEQVVRYEENVFTATVRGNRGTARIHIDRMKEHRVKRITVRADGAGHTHEWTRSDLLDLEIAHFVEAMRNGSAGNKKRQQIDESIAAVIEELKRTSGPMTRVGQPGNFHE
jgi:predicted dehydrogenase